MCRSSRPGEGDGPRRSVGRIAGGAGPVEHVERRRSRPRAAVAKRARKSESPLRQQPTVAKTTIALLGELKGELNNMMTSIVDGIKAIQNM